MTGLFFGSFNPIHNGHLAIANYLLDKVYCDEVWFIVSPQNPFKQDASLLSEDLRLEMVNRAIATDSRLKACAVEFTMPKPSYTVDTLIKLSEIYPGRKFALIIGADNLTEFHLWKGYREILEHWPVLVYPRPGIDVSGINYKGAEMVNAPLSNISSTEIRCKVRCEENISKDIPFGIQSLVLENYKK